jgi:hypothetical protein
MKKHESPAGMATISAYSRHRGCHRSYVGRLVERGLLPHVVTPRGVKLIDIAKADSILDDMPTTDELRGGAGREKQQTAYAQARIIKTVFDAKLARLDFETREGKLIEAEGVRARIQEHLAAIRIGLDALADRLTPLLAGERDAKRVHAIMKTEIRAELVRIAAIVGGSANAGAPSAA